MSRCIPWFCTLSLAACDLPAPDDSPDEAASRAEVGAQALPEDPSGPPPLYIFETCGDPVCMGWRPKNLPDCPSRATVGMRCPPRLLNRQCDPHDDCNTTWMCTDQDPTGGGNCPISKRDAKKDIAYLDATELAEVARRAQAIKLATWRYKAEASDAPTHLGFLIDDLAPSPAVRSDGERVDLYGYTSMALAAVQAQQAQIDALRAEVQALKARLADR